MTSLYVHPRLGEVTLSQTVRARRISISVRATGAVRLSFPCGVPQKRALVFWSKSGMDRGGARRLAPQAGIPASAVAARGAESPHRGAAPCGRSRPAGPHRRLSEATGLKCRKLSIRASRTKWGSCSGRNHISLSLFLMTLPEHLRDYVIVHELCHTVHHDHSPRFHALVDRLVGGREKALNRELRAFSIR